MLGQPRFTPSRALAGKPLTVRVPARRSDTNAGLAGGTTTCTVRAGGAIRDGTRRRGDRLGDLPTRRPEGHVTHDRARLDRRDLRGEERDEVVLPPRGLIRAVEVAVTAIRTI